MTRPRVLPALLLLAWLAGAVPSSAAAPAPAPEPVRIGVLAFRPKPQTLEQWRPLEAALGRAIPGRTFAVEALSYPELNDAVAARRLDFVLTNPGHFVLLRRQQGLSSPLATLAAYESGQRTSAFGGVIFTRAGPGGPRTLADLAGRTLAVPGTESLGGYQMQAYELARAGVRLPQDAALVVTGMPHDTVVKAVLEGRAEAGFVRSGVLEGLAREGRLDPARVRILNLQHPPGFPVQVSTRLYPEWPFAALAHVDEDLARHVASTLFVLEENTAATRALGIHGFGVPSDYGAVDDLLRELRLPPYDAAPTFTLGDVWARYRWQAVGAGLAAGLILLLGFRLQRANRKLAAEHRVVLLQQGELQEREETLRTYMGNSFDVIFSLDGDGVLRFLSEAWERHFGIPVQDALGRPFAGFTHPEDAAAWTAYLQRTLETGEGGMSPEFRVRGLDGGWRWLVAHGSPFPEAGGGRHFIGVAHDITERRRTEAALREEQERLDLAVTATGLGLYDWNPATGAVVYSGLWAAMFGFTLDEIRADDSAWAERVHPDDLPATRRAFLDACRDDSLYLCEYRMRHRDGSWRWILDQGRIVARDAQGAVTRFVGGNQDITRRKQAEAARQELLERLQKLAGRLPGVVFQYRLDPGGRDCFPFASEALLGIFGVTPEEVQEDAAKVFAAIHPEDLPAVQASIRASAQALAPWAQEYRVRAGDGAVRTLLSNAVPQQEPDGSVLWHGFTADITDRKRLEAQLHQAQKMESLGLLAGGVAHDMNNVLGAILGLASIHQELQPAGSPAHRAFATISLACTRGGDLVRSLLGFARQGLAEEKDLDLNALVREQVRLLERTTLAQVRLEMDLAEDLRPIRGDAGALTHVLMNLCINALDAMPRDGLLALRTRNLGEDRVELGVEDTGSGMPPEVLARALDPFFTTKAQGKGTGLGLSIAHSTVTAHRGQMELRSEAGLGTQVLLRFPACAVAAAAAPGLPPVPAGGRAGTPLVVLLVDDDDLIRTSMESVLGLLGHAVTAVPSGEAALAVLASGLAPDLVVLDMNMPGLGGAGTLPRLRATHPSVPVLLATGRSDQTALDLVKAHPGVTLLPKPFGVAEFQRHLDLVLTV